MASDAEPQFTAPPTRRGSGAFGTYVMAFVMFTVLVAACVVGGYFFYMGGKEAPKFTVTGFDMDDVKPVSQTPDPNYVPAPRQTVASPQPIAGLPGLTEANSTPGNSAEKAAQAKRDGPPSGRVETAEAKRESEWLAKNGSVMRQTHAKLNQIAMKYYQKFPVVREVDAAFARMPRYMAIKARFDKDGNPYNFARDAIALVEVRGEIARRMADPNAWKAALGMITEGLRTNPPKEVYGEAKRFLRDDKDVMNYMTDDFQNNFRKSSVPMGQALQGMSQSEVQSLSALAKDLNPAGAGIPVAAPAMPQKPAR